LSLYSDRKNAKATSGLPAATAEATAFTSPPAQKAFPPAPRSRIAEIVGSASHCEYWRKRRTT
jgi:hypothetical protein